MKKNLIPIITILAIVSIILVVFLSMANSQNMTTVSLGNHKKEVLPMVVGKFQDSDCGMVIDQLEFSSQVISPSGKTWFFHDHGGMAHWIANKTFKDEAVIWVMTLDTKKYIDGRKAWYSRTDDTPMDYGFGAYEHKKNNLIDFNTMFLYMNRGENLTNPLIKKQLLGDTK